MQIRNATSARMMTDKPEKPGKATPKPTVINEHIGRELRALFDSVVAEPVPDKFHELLEQLERKQVDAPATEPTPVESRLPDEVGNKQRDVP
jgi:hypothetical protein